MKSYKINSFKKFLLYYQIIKEYMDGISSDCIVSTNLKNNYMFNDHNDSLLYLFKYKDLFYENGYYEIIKNGNDFVGGSGVYIKDGIKYLYKRTYVYCKYRKYNKHFKYSPHDLFLEKQLNFGDDYHFAINTYNEQQQKLFIATKRILQNKSISIGTKRNNELYFKYPIYLLDDMYYINGELQYVIIFDVNGIGINRSIEVLDGKFKKLHR